MAKRKVYFRADGNSKLGWGHIYRSLAVADMIRGEFDCHFIIKNPLPSLVIEIEKYCKSIILPPLYRNNLEEAIYLTKDVVVAGDIIVLDGYHFTTEYQNVFIENQNRIISIDDVHNCHFVSDVVINHAPNVKISNYDLATGSRLCSGISFAMLRKPFFECLRNSKVVERTIFICFGGTDQYNLTYKLLLQLKQRQNNLKLNRVNVVVNPINEKFDDILQLSVENSTLDIQLYSDLNALEMRKIMYSSEVGVVSASGILQEALACNLPVVTGFYVENQVEVYRGFESMNVVIGAGDLNKANIIDDGIILALEQKTSLRDRISKLDVSKSPMNHLKVFRYIDLLITCKLRNAEAGDVDLYYNWANDRSVRINAFNSNDIPYENHVKWFSGRLENSSVKLFVLENAVEQIGQIRLEEEKNNWVVNYSIDKNFRNKGYGTVIAKLVIEKMLNMGVNTKLIARVKKDNIPSSKVFVNLGFVEIESNENEYFEYQLFLK